MINKFEKTKDSSFIYNEYIFYKTNGWNKSALYSNHWLIRLHGYKNLGWTPRALKDDSIVIIIFALQKLPRTKKSYKILKKLILNNQIEIDQISKSKYPELYNYGKLSLI